jgi:K+-transporting ATPase ATPase C chain
MNMSQIFKKSLWLMLFSVVLTCVVYPLVLLAIGQTIFPFQSNGSILKGPDGQVVGSELIAQSFTKDEYFQPRPSAASYNGMASSSSSLSVSNYALRNRAAIFIGPIVTYASGRKKGQLVGPDVENWFKEDHYQGKAHIVSQWAVNHPALAQGWLTSDSLHTAFAGSWINSHPGLISRFKKDNPTISQPGSADIAVLLLQDFSNTNPRKFLSAVADTISPGKIVVSLKPVDAGADIQSIFFDMWRQDNPGAPLQNIPADMVTTSASGLDPDISYQNAIFQLERVSTKWAANLKRNTTDVRKEIEDLIHQHSFAPMHGLSGERMVRVLPLNLALRTKYGSPS